MTMHLAQGFSTVRTNRKLKPKYTKANIEKWTEELRLHNKRMKQLGEPKLSFEQYVDYVHGKITTSTKQKFVPYQSNSSARRETPSYPSHDGGSGLTPKKEPMKYTGTLVKGIATMHKSNAVPIIDDQHAKDISSMRR